MLYEANLAMASFNSYLQDAFSGEKLHNTLISYCISNRCTSIYLHLSSRWRWVAYEPREMEL